MSIVLAILITVVVVGAVMAEADHQARQRLHRAYWKQLDLISQCLMRTGGIHCNELDTVLEHLALNPRDTPPALDAVLRTPMQPRVQESTNDRCKGYQGLG